MDTFRIVRNVKHDVAHNPVAGSSKRAVGSPIHHVVEAHAKIAGTIYPQPDRACIGLFRAEFSAQS